MLDLKKIRVVTNFFKGKKIIKILNFIYNLFFRARWSQRPPWLQCGVALGFSSFWCKRICV